MAWTAVVVTAINISVFNIWIPARCQINDTYVPKSPPTKYHPPVEANTRRFTVYRDRALTRNLTANRYILVNNIWDRIEKVIYLFIDAALNWYFLKVVKANLINNGLQKYNKLLRFNQKIIIISLLMDVMIIAAMSIPNTFM